jgi:hypothetical protein
VSLSLQNVVGAFRFSAPPEAPKSIQPSASSYKTLGGFKNASSEHFGNSFSESEKYISGNEKLKTFGFEHSTLNASVAGVFKRSMKTNKLGNETSQLSKNKLSKLPQNLSAPLRLSPTLDPEAASAVVTIFILENGRLVDIELYVKDAREKNQATLCLEFADTIGVPNFDVGIFSAPESQVKNYLDTHVVNLTEFYRHMGFIGGFKCPVPWHVGR